MLLIEPLPNHRYKLVTKHVYKDVVIKDYITNGANIPRMFWWYIPPNMSDIMEAVIVHDYLCDKGEFAKGDAYFKELLDKTDIGKVKIFILHKGVLFWHFMRYSLFNKIKKMFKIEQI